MAFALVGTIGAISQSASGASVTPAWGTSENRTAGNLLICFCVATGSSNTLNPPTGWNTSHLAGGTSVSSDVFWKIATGADAAPTVPAVTGAILTAQLAEFSGNAAASPLDKTGAAAPTVSPATAIFNAVDTAVGELLVIASGDFRSANRSPTDTLTSNNATITQAGNNNGVSATTHYSFGYSLATTSNSAADTAIMTASATQSITGLAVTGATFLLAPPPSALPEFATEPLTPSRWHQY